jgi:hypothetical protein
MESGLSAACWPRVAGNTAVCVALRVHTVITTNSEKQNWDKPMYDNLLHVSALHGNLQGVQSTFAKYRIFSNLIRTSFCRFLKRKKVSSRFQSALFLQPPLAYKAD